MNKAFGLLVAALLFAGVTAYASDGTTGTWSIERNPGATVQLHLVYEGSSHSDESSTIALSRLGLTPQALNAAVHPASFAMRGDPGTLNFAGRIGNGAGSGRYTFTPDPAYANAITAYGMNAPDIPHEVAALMMDISLAYAGAMEKAGVHPQSFDHLIALRALKATPQSVAALHRRLGAFDEEQLIALVALHVDPAYLDELAGAGYEHLSAHDAITLKAMHINAAYIMSLRARGYAHLPVQRLVEMKALHTPAGTRSPRVHAALGVLDR